MNNFLKSLPLILLVSCGKPVEQIQHPITQNIHDKLESKLESLQSKLLKCDGGPTDELNNALTGRAVCDTGDSISPVGLIATVYIDPDFSQYLARSIGSDGRPYRSPEHKEYCENSPNKDTDPGCNFSRDHLLGHMMYAIATKNSTYLLAIRNYMENNYQRICVGTVSQCWLTPSVWDVLGDTLEYLDLPKPIMSRVPDPVTITSELITTAANSEFQLALVSEIIYIKLLTGNLNSRYFPVINKLVEKAPYNTFFRFLQNKIILQDKEINNQLAEELIAYIDRWEVERKQQTVWFWSWDEIENANAWSFFFMGNLLLKEGSF